MVSVAGFVTPVRYVVGMDRTQNTERVSADLESWSGVLEVWRAAGLSVTVVERCPAPWCEVCDRRLATAA